MIDNNSTTANDSSKVSFSLVSNNTICLACASMVDGELICNDCVESFIESLDEEEVEHGVVDVGLQFYTIRN